MNGKKAKHLRKMAESYVLNVEKKPLGTGYNSYRQVDNRIDWAHHFDDDGDPLLDPDGVPYMKPYKTPGTIFTEYLVRIIYKKLKKVHPHGDPNRK